MTYTGVLHAFEIRKWQILLWKKKSFIFSYILESIQMVLSINFHSSAESFLNKHPDISLKHYGTVN